MGVLGTLNEDTTQKNKTVYNNSEGSSVIGASLFLHSKILNGRYISSDQGSTATVSIELRYYILVLLSLQPSTSEL